GAGQLRRPGPVRVCGATGAIHAPSAELDEEEDVQTSEPQRFGGEEVARYHRLSMRTEKRPPAEPSPRSGGRHAGLTVGSWPRSSLRLARPHPRAHQRSAGSPSEGSHEQDAERAPGSPSGRSEEHTSELQSPDHL